MHDKHKHSNYTNNWAGWLAASGKQKTTSQRALWQLNKTTTTSAITYSSDTFLKYCKHFSPLWREKSQHDGSVSPSKCSAIARTFINIIVVVVISVATGAAVPWAIKRRQWFCWWCITADFPPAKQQTWNIRNEGKHLELPSACSSTSLVLWATQPS